MLKVLYVVSIGLLGAAIVHLAVILLLPHVSPESPWTQLRNGTPAFAFVTAAGPDHPASARSPGSDPLFMTASCRFTLESPVVFRAEGAVPFWTLSIFDSEGAAFFGVNDRVSTDGRLDVVIATPAQVIELRKAVPDALSRAVIAQSASEEGFAVLRAFVPDPSWNEIVSAYLREAECTALAE